MTMAAGRSQTQCSVSATSGSPRCPGPSMCRGSHASRIAESTRAAIGELVGLLPPAALNRPSSVTSPTEPS
jgi:hypothetical protein